MTRKEYSKTWIKKTYNGKGLPDEPQIIRDSNGLPVWSRAFALYVSRLVAQDWNSYDEATRAQRRLRRIGPWWPCKFNKEKACSKKCGDYFPAYTGCQWVAGTGIYAPGCLAI